MHKEELEREKQKEIIKKESEQDLPGLEEIYEEEIKGELLLDGNGRSMSDLCRDIAALLKLKDILFYRPNSQQIVEVSKIKIHNTGEDLYTGFKEIRDKRLVTLIEKYVSVGYNVEKKFGEAFIIKSLSPNKASIVLCSEILEQALPQVERIFTAPLPIIYGDTLTFPKVGYDPRFNSWLSPDSPRISNLDMNLKEAKSIINKMLSEFCFPTEQDKTNAIAGILTPFLKGLFENFNTRTPIIFYIGNRERVGKDYLAGIKGIIYEGQAVDDSPVSSGERSGNNNEELRKKITSALLGGRKSMHFANNKGYINNAILEHVSTSKYISDRLLGQNTLINLPNEMDFSLSGNVGITYTPDLANRSIFVNLFLDIEDANERKFKTPLLHEWVLEKRELILSALYSLVQNWFKNKMKKGSLFFASFPEWANVCGGIMESAGYGNPCVRDSESFSIGGDTETEEMKELFETCYKFKSNQWIKRNELITIIKESGSDLFSYWDLDKASDLKKLGKILVKFNNRLFSDIRLIIKDLKVKGSRRDYKFMKNKSVQTDLKGKDVTPVNPVTPSPTVNNLSSKVYSIVQKGNKGYKGNKTPDNTLNLDNISKENPNLDPDLIKQQKELLKSEN